MLVMGLQELGKALSFSLGGAVTGVVVAVVAGRALGNYVGGENAPLLWLVGGISGLVLGLSQASWRRRRRRRRRRRPQVVLPPMKMADDSVAAVGAESVARHAAAPSADADRVSVGDARALFGQATDATPAELTNVRVCDIRLDSSGEPLSVRLSQDGQEREVFLVHDHHRDIVAEALDAALQREPGNRRAKLFT
ncbi:MAG: hypothetical protein CFK52_11660 [Chloracidobacterium sp. CP2_5A]|nr:MAG: hypothetical protein CFK52_11660 [Chloracidobacterium sp. CP2_5A]